MPDKTTKPRSKLDRMSEQEVKILNLLREERRIAKEKFPLVYALLATFGLVCLLGGLNKLIERVDWLNENPLYLVVMGLAILLITGAAYKKLS